MSEVYPEIHLEIQRGIVRYSTPLASVMSDTCPTCKACLIRRDDVNTPYESAHYACGGSYTSKPQIQNHHDVWWGHCGNTKINRTK